LSNSGIAKLFRSCRWATVSDRICTVADEPLTDHDHGFRVVAPAVSRKNPARTWLTVAIAARWNGHRGCRPLKSMPEGESADQDAGDRDPDDHPADAVPQPADDR